MDSIVKGLRAKRDRLDGAYENAEITLVARKVDAAREDLEVLEAKETSARLARQLRLANEELWQAESDEAFAANEGDD
jgi:hypothetical protein